MKKKMKFKGRRYAEGGIPEDGAMMAPTYDSPPEDMSEEEAVETGMAGLGKAATSMAGMAGPKMAGMAGLGKAGPKMAGMAGFSKPRPNRKYKPTEGPQKRFLGPKEKPLLLPKDRSQNFGVTEEDRLTDDQLKTIRNAAITAGLATAPFGIIAKGVQRMKRDYDTGKRVNAMTQNEQMGAMLKAARKAKEVPGMKSGGSVKSSASSRADGIAQRGKTRGRNC